MAILVLLLIWASLQYSCTAQGFAECDDSDEGEDCSEDIGCIEEYGDLESYVLSNKRLLGNLRKAFFNFSYGTSKFLTITYSFQVYDTSSNDSNCSSHQAIYIWSDTVLYLLGPKPLFWLTLFAVNIHEADVTVELPCLCDGAYNTLLSQLTFMVKVYAAMKYHDQPLQFMNKNYFQINNTHEQNNQIIQSILVYLAILPSTLYLVLGGASMLYFYSKVYGIIENFKQNSCCNPKFQTHRLSILFINIKVTIALFVFHIFSIIEQMESSLRGNSLVSVILSSMIIFPLVLTAVAAFVFMTIYKPRKSCIINASTFSVLINVTYLGGNFMPYMILAFIVNPLQTIFTYLVLVFIIAVVFILLFLLLSPKCDKRLAAFFTPYIVIASGLSVSYFLIVIIYVFTLGSFTEFQGLENLLLTLIIGLFTILAWKPAKTYYLTQFNQGSNNRNSQGSQQGGEDRNEQITTNNNLSANNGVIQNTTAL